MWLWEQVFQGEDEEPMQARHFSYDNDEAPLTCSEAFMHTLLCSSTIPEGLSHVDSMLDTYNVLCLAEQCVSL